MQVSAAPPGPPAGAPAQAPLPPMRGPGIRAKLAIAFGLAGLAVALFVLAAVERHHATIDHAAILEAQHVAAGIADRAQAIGLNRSQELQEFVTRLNRREKRDVVILDTRKTGLADADADEIGQAYDADRGNEVALTLADGMPRIFLERNKHHPAGARQVVVPIRSEAGAVAGAVVLEYTPIRELMLAASRDDLMLVAMTGAAVIAFVAALGFAITGHLMPPLTALTEAVLHLDRNDYDARVEVSREDELGFLAHAFNRMADNVRGSMAALSAQRDLLEQRGAELQAANAALQAQPGEPRPEGPDPRPK